MLNGVPVYVLCQSGFRVCGCVPCLWPQLGQDRGALSHCFLHWLWSPWQPQFGTVQILRGFLEQTSSTKSHYMYTMSFSMCLIFPCPSHISSTLKEFGKFSGYKFLDKSEIATAVSQISFYFLLLKIAYNRITLSSPKGQFFFTSGLYPAGFYSLVHCVLITGRRNTIKMNILPKFLHLRLCVPSFTSNDFFKKPDNLISLSIWDIKTALEMIFTRAKMHGGMVSPNFQTGQ